jgi:RNA polymerase primary sigma factor
MPGEIDMAKEIESDEFKKLITLGEEKGFLTYDDVNDLLPSDVISSDQIDDIIMLFGEKNIDIIDSDKGEKLVVKKPTDERADSKRDDILGLLPAVGRTGDPVKMYLREMGLVSLLSREGEVEIAKVIEEGAQESMEAVFSVTTSLKDVVNIGVQLKSGAIRVKSVVDNLEDEDGVMEEDMHRDRVTKLLDKVTVLDGKNDLIRKKLGGKGIGAEERLTLKGELDKNLRNIVKLCRKVRFSKRQIDRMVANLRVWINQVEQVEEAVRRCKKDTGLSLAQMEEIWAKMNKSARSGEQAARKAPTANSRRLPRRPGFP